MTVLKRFLVPLLAATMVAGVPVAAQQQQAASPSASADYRQRLPQDEVIYFVLPDRFENGDPKNDRGGLKGDRLKTGFDPSAKGYFQGGDLKGLTQKLDYIQGLGVTAIWFAPIFKNKVVQGPKGDESAGYHGYWVTDFTRPDPHFGSSQEFKAFVDAAHARGMKVYMDIITNHTADVIQYKECVDTYCHYRSKGDYPYWSEAGTGKPINPTFMGDKVMTRENFASLTNPNYAYTPFVAPAEKTVKIPAWLNDVRYYHNRGNSTFKNEDSTYGDFSGLDDLMTEDPRVVDGFIEIYGDWIERTKIDGFRIDTAKHVNPEFWQRFAPAMLARAKANGIPNFHIFGEVYDESMEPGLLAMHTRRDKLPAALDFSFQQAVKRTVAGTAGTDVFARVFSQDVLFEGGDEGAMLLPVFLGNHDMGRIGHFIEKGLPGIGEEEKLARVKLAHALMMFARGAAVIYYGDEQGFTGDGGDQLARESLFASKTALYNDNDLIGSDRTTAVENFNTGHPLYRAIADMAKVRADNEGLRRGKLIMRGFGDKPGLVAWSRIGADGVEYIFAANTSAQSITANVEVDRESGTAWHTLIGQCSGAESKTGQLKLTVPAFGYSVCKASQ